MYGFCKILSCVNYFMGFLGGPVVKRLPVSAGDMDLILVQEDLTCRVTTKSMHHNYGACALEPVLHGRRSRLSEKSMHHS